MSAAVLPTNASNKSLTWSITSGTGFATINSSTGILTATDNGSVTIRATANDGSGVDGTLTVTISNQVIAVTSITVSGVGGTTTITTDGGTLQLSAAVLPANATNKSVTWSITSGSGRASINSSTGLVKATDNGTVTIRATASDGSGIYGSLVITVSNQVIPVTGITVTGAGGVTTIAGDGGTLQLSAGVLPSNATNKTVTWSVANGTGQATISSAGVVTAESDGTVTARATANDGSGVYGTLVITISNQFIPVSKTMDPGVDSTRVELEGVKPNSRRWIMSCAESSRIVLSVRRPSVDRDSATIGPPGSRLCSCRAFFAISRAMAWKPFRSVSSNASSSQSCAKASLSTDRSTPACAMAGANAFHILRAAALMPAGGSGMPSGNRGSRSLNGRWPGFPSIFRIAVGFGGNPRGIMAPPVRRLFCPVAVPELLPQTSGHRLRALAAFPSDRYTAGR